MRESRYEVIVVGGGPAGSSCAAFCARRGLRVALLDRASFPRHKVCGDFLNPKCWEVFERLGVTKQVRELPNHESPGFLFSTLAGRVVQIQFAEEIRQKHRSVALSRRLLDDRLLRHAKSMGVEVIESATVVGLQREQEWIIEYQIPDGRDRVVAPTLVGADGRHSFVGRQAGLLRREATDDRVGIQFIFRDVESMSDCIQLHQLRDGYCGAVKIGDGLANVCMVTPKRRAASQSPESLRANPVLAGFLNEAKLADKPRSITPILGAEYRASGDGVLLVGDAARVIEPFTGQGIYFALRSGELAAEAIARGDFRGYESTLDAEYRTRARTNRLMREILWRDWAVRGVARIADLRPKWMNAIVASVIQ